MTAHESNLGKWDRYNGHVFPYGATASYHQGVEWLSDQPVIADWGCGPGYLKTLLKPGIKYIGIDGSKSPNADVIADLETYRNDVPALFMRHVLEHNHNWKAIMQNALASFQNKFFLVLFTPLQEGPTRDIRMDFNHADVPDMAFNIDEFTQIIVDAGCQFRCQLLPSGLTAQGNPATEYGSETIFRITK